MSKELLPSINPGQFRLIEKIQINDGPYKGQSYEMDHFVYDSMDAAAIAGNKAAKGKTVFVGILTHEVEGKKYYKPGFNVFD